MGREVTDKRVIEMIGCRLHCIVEQMKAGLFNSNEKKNKRGQGIRNLHFAEVQL